MDNTYGLILGTKTIDQTIPLLVDSTLKIIFVLLAALYLAFAFVIIRQIHIMKNTLITHFSSVISLLGYLHFGLALIVFCMFLLI